MRNRFAGQCYRCGKTVEPLAGHFEKIPNGGWRVQHAECAIKYRGQPEVVFKKDVADAASAAIKDAAP